MLLYFWSTATRLRFRFISRPSNWQSRKSPPLTQEFGHSWIPIRRKRVNIRNWNCKSLIIFSVRFQTYLLISSFSNNSNSKIEVLNTESLTCFAVLYLWFPFSIRKEALQIFLIPWLPDALLYSVHILPKTNTQNYSIYLTAHERQSATSVGKR